MQETDARDEGIEPLNEEAVVDLQDDEEEWDKLSKEQKTAKTTAALKSLRVKRKKYNKSLASRDLFVVGNASLEKNIVKIRKKAIDQRERKFDFITLSCDHFDRTMEYRRQILKSRREKSIKGNFVFPVREHEVSYKRIMAERRRNNFM